MTEKPKILCICDCDDVDGCVPTELHARWDVVIECDPLRAFARLAEQQFEGLYVLSPHLNESLQLVAVFVSDASSRQATCKRFELCTQLIQVGDLFGGKRAHRRATPFLDLDHALTLEPAQCLPHGRS